MKTAFFHRRRSSFVGVLLLSVTLVLPAARLLAAEPPLPKFPPFEFRPPKPERVTLPNGLTLFLLEDHELPLIRGSLYFKAGSQYDPADKIGLFGIFGEVMGRGGSQAMTPEEIEKLLDQRAASIGFSVALETGQGSFMCRASDFDQIFGVFADLLLRPGFRKDQLDLSKSKTLEFLRRMNDDPEDVARREFRKVVYGAGHPYARTPTPTTVKAIKREDLIQMHAHVMHPNTSFLAVAGDFNAAEMKAKIEKGLGAWSNGTGEYLPVPATPKTVKRQVYYIQRDINQSQIRIGGLGLQRHSPDHFAWEVFNELWGGSSTSRLFSTVRTKQGLAYSVGSAFSEPAQTGLIVAISQTRGPQTIEAAQSMLQITKEVRSAPFTPQELSWSKESIRNRFVENFTSSYQIVSERASLAYLGFPDDYLDTYTDRIGKVQLSDLKHVGETYLHPDEAAILLVGDLSTFEKPVSSLGGRPQEIKLINYSEEP